MTRWWWLLVALIVLMAAVLRVWRLDELPSTLYIDEVAMLVDARSVAERGVDIHGDHWWQTIFPSYGDYKLPLYIWISSTLMQIFGGDAWVIRLPSALAGVGSVLIIILLARRLADVFQFSRMQASVFSLSAGFVMAVSPWSVLFSRTAFEGHLGQFFFLTSLLALTYFPRWWAALAAALLGTLATYSYFSVLIVWIGCAALVLGSLIFTQIFAAGRVSWKLIVRGFFLPAVGMVILYALLLQPLTQNALFADMQQFRLSTPSLLNTTDHILQSSRYRDVLGDSMFSRVLLHREIFRAQKAVEHVGTHITPSYLFLTGDPYLRHSTGRHGVFLWPFALPLIVGVYMLRRRPVLAALLGGWWGLAVLPAAMTDEVPHALRSLNALGAASLVIAYGMMSIGANLYERLKNHPIKLRLLLTSIAVLIIVVVAEFAWYFSRIYPERTHASHWFSLEASIATQVSANVQPSEPLLVYWPGDKWFLWYMAAHPDWYTNEVVKRHHLFTRISDFYFLTNHTLPEDVEYPVWVVTKQDQLEQLQSLHSWQILEQHPVATGSVDDAYITKVSPYGN